MLLTSYYSIPDRPEQELPAHGTCAFPVTCYHCSLTVRRYAWQWHDELELIVMLEGAATVYTDTCQHKLEKGEGLFINATILHKLSPVGSGSCRLYSVVFLPKLIGGSMDSIYWQDYLYPLIFNIFQPCTPLFPDQHWQAEIIEQTKDVCHICQLKTPGYEFSVREKLSRAVFLLTSHSSPIHRHLHKKLLRDTIRIKQMLQYIHFHYQEPINMRQISESAGISSSEALRCFHASLDVTPIQYVKQYRLERAAKRLVSTSEKIAAVGNACGFREISYFVKIFRDAYGCTPSEFRKRRKSADRESDIFR